MANPVSTRSPGEAAAEEFTAFFNAEINNSDRFTENGQLIRLNTPETYDVQGRYATLLSNLNSTVDRATFYNRVARLLGNYDPAASDAERARVNALSGKLAGAFNGTTAGVQLQAQAKAPVPSGIDLSQVTDAATAREVFNAFLTSQALDDTQWTVKVAADDPAAPYNGQRVHFGGPETNRLKSLISEIIAKLPRDEAMTFSNQATTALRSIAANTYERDRTVPNLLNHLSREIQRK